MEIKSLSFDGKILHIIDQRYLPFEIIDSPCTNEKDVWEAINLMKIRGAPAIGVAAAYGMYLGIINFDGSREELLDRIKKFKFYLDSARPTAVNLQWATQRILNTALSQENCSSSAIKGAVLKEAMVMENEDAERNYQIGVNGAQLFKDNDTIMTICNTGNFATVRYGTAFSVIARTHEKYNNIKVIALETRPYLQGARLTAFELKEEGIPFKLITDNTAAFLMSKGLVSAVISGADRIAVNGDTANKIGTYMLAVLAKFHNIPFYVAAPISTIDLNTKSGKDIPIEERNPDEVTNFGGKRIAPFGVDVYNFSFDVTPNELISAIITDRGVLYPPLEESIKSILV
jgi:methylthioribose-1-phosphate isomerase